MCLQYQYTAPQRVCPFRGESEHRTVTAASVGRQQSSASGTLPGRTDPLGYLISSDPVVAACPSTKHMNVRRSRCVSLAPKSILSYRAQR